eukprot:g24316.t1
MTPTPDHQNIISQTIRNLITSGDLLPQPPTSSFPNPALPVSISFPKATNLTALANPLPNQSPSTDILIGLTELVLTLNNFSSFNSSNFLQTKGVAMGTHMGPSYACFFVGYVEQPLFRSYTGTILRYIDDCIGTASCSHKELEQFINFTNTFHPN